ncbi:hypothetical protein GCM10027600_00150 [Nocardioides ginsengisegetis]|uniref:ATP-binding protein n=1 Tax=Nocardioides ginsengisegetis TaxID=661491 RepID=UPI0031B6159C
MSSGGGAPGPDATGGGQPRAPLGHLSRLGFALRNAHDLDEVARSLLADFVSLPDVSRVGLALTEGGGRRLRFVATDKVGDADLEWCHIDAYDDVPLTAVVRSGEPVFGSLDDLEPRFPGVVGRQRNEGTLAMGAWPLPGTGSPVGGLILFFDEPQAFGERQQRLLEAAARRTADAVRRVRIATGRGPDEVAPDDPALVGQGERVAVLLESDPRAPGAARRFLREALAGWGIDDDAVDTAQLCLSELVTNVVMHARTSSELIVALEDGVLTVLVRDLGGSSRSGDPTTITISEDDDPLRVFGRGLMLVDALADRWGSEQDATGTTAWFALELGSGSNGSLQTG